MQVLLVEDGIDNRRLLTHYLTRAGAAVDFATNGQEALTVLLANGNRNKYDVDPETSIP